jgi:competence protein ComFC
LARLRLLADTCRLAGLVVFPSFCRTCGALLERRRDGVLCAACLEKIQPHRAPFCPVCGRFYEGETKNHVCGRCLVSPPPFDRHRSAGRYGGILKDALLLLKYQRLRPLGPVLGGMAFEAARAETEFWRGIDLVVPVPLHRKRRRERGFNQSEIIAGEIGRRSGTPVNPGALRKTRPTPPQTSLEREERVENVRDAYARGRKCAVSGRVVLLIDDVFTTGSTLGECARVMRREGAAEVRALTVAQA